MIFRGCPIYVLWLHGSAGHVLGVAPHVRRSRTRSASLSLASNSIFAKWLSKRTAAATRRQNASHRPHKTHQGKAGLSRHGNQDVVFFIASHQQRLIDVHTADVILPQRLANFGPYLAGKDIGQFILGDCIHTCFDSFSRHYSVKSHGSISRRHILQLAQSPA